MAQRARFQRVTDTKMFAKKMHRLVKKMQDKPADSLDMLSDMARKRGENLMIPIEVDTELQWSALLKREGLIVVDVFSGWSGPCTSMFSILRKLKMDTNDDRLILAAANADNIGQLFPFRNQSEPCWLFVGGGKPVNVLRGSNAPKLMKTIKSEFLHELECIEGKGKRNMISIKFEAGRRERAVNEAIALDQLMLLEEEQIKAKKKPHSKSPTPGLNEDEEKNEVEAKEDFPEVQEEPQEPENGEEETGEHKEAENPLQVEIDEAALERMKLMEESNLRLKEALRFCTVIAIQSYLLETGAVTEIKDYIAGEFKLVRERYITLNDIDARKLFAIPEEIPDPNPPSAKDGYHSDMEENHVEANEGNLENPTSQSNSAVTSPVPANIDESGENPDEDGSSEDNEENGSEGDGEGDGDRKRKRKKREKTPVRMIPVLVPEVIIGDTLILLLECIIAEHTVGKESEETAHDADYYISERTGSVDYEIAMQTQPNSLHALYGKENYVAGVWCPRTYEEKRFVMLNYFPQFVTEMLTPPIPDPPKYHIFVFSALFSSEILEHPEYVRGKQHIVDVNRMRIPHHITEKMLIASKREGDYLKAMKWALTGTDVLVVSADSRNPDLIQILDCFDPIFASRDILEAGYFTAKLFPDVEVLMDEEPFAQEQEVEVCNLANLVEKLSSEGVQDEESSQKQSDVEE